MDIKDSWNKSIWSDIKIEATLNIIYEILICMWYTGHIIVQTEHKILWFELTGQFEIWQQLSILIYKHRLQIEFTSTSCDFFLTLMP